MNGSDGQSELSQWNPRGGQAVAGVEANTLHLLGVL